MKVILTTLSFLLLFANAHSEPTLRSLTQYPSEVHVYSVMYVQTVEYGERIIPIHGMGMLIAPNRVILNKHTVRFNLPEEAHLTMTIDRIEYFVRDKDGVLHKARFAALDRNGYDLAALTLDTSLESSDIHFSKKWKSQESITIQSDNSPITGTIAGLGTTAAGLPFISAHLHEKNVKGNSGKSVYKDDGSVLGIIEGHGSTAHDLRIIPATAIQSFVATLGG